MHWVHAAAFGGMLLTGVALYAPGLAGTFGSREAVKSAHVTIAAVWLVALLVTVALGDRRGLRETRRQLELLDVDDARWLRGRPAPQGRFNAGQKLHAVLQAACATLFVISGILLLGGERNTSLRLDGTIALHDALTIISTILVAGHLYLAVLHRSTRPALSGMLSGRVDAGWAAEHHTKWKASADPARTNHLALGEPSTWMWLACAVAVAVLALTQA